MLLFFVSRKSTKSTWVLPPLCLIPSHEPAVRHSAANIRDFTMKSKLVLSPLKSKTARLFLVCTFVVEDTDTPSEGGGAGAGGAGPWNLTPRHDPSVKHSLDWSFVPVDPSRLKVARFLLVCTFVVEDTDTPSEGGGGGAAGPWNLTPLHDPSVKHSLDWNFVPVDPSRLKVARFLLVCTFVVEDTDTPSEGGGGGAAGPWNLTPLHDPSVKHSLDWNFVPVDPSRLKVARFLL